MTPGPHWVLKVDRQAGAAAGWMECFSEPPHRRKKYILGYLKKTKQNTCLMKSRYFCPPGRGLPLPDLDTGTVTLNPNADLQAQDDRS